MDKNKMKQKWNSLIDIILDRQEVIGHGLQGQFVQQGRYAVEAAIYHEQLGASLLGALAHCGLVGLQKMKSI